jgi:hypothetical protein
VRECPALVRVQSNLFFVFLLLCVRVQDTQRGRGVSALETFFIGWASMFHLSFEFVSLFQPKTFRRQKEQACCPVIAVSGNIRLHNRVDKQSSNSSYFAILFCTF